VKHKLLSYALLIPCCIALPAFASTCPTTATTTTDCDYLITIGSTGIASVAEVPGSMPFNTAQTFVDGTSDPGSDGSLVGVINDYSHPLSSLTLQGAGASEGIFDFSFNGICVYTNASYCGTAASGYEGPTTTFTNLQSTIPFETTVGTVDFGPALTPGSSTYFSIEDAASDINANGGLTVLGTTFVPEPSPALLFGLGFATLLLAAVGSRLKLRVRA
jgi:hypothetical protein